MGKFLQVADHVPALFVFNLLVHIVDDLLHDAFLARSGTAVLKFGHEALHGSGHDVLVVEVNAEGTGEIELVGEIGEERLEEGVDGLHTEMVVVVDDVGQQILGATEYFSFREADGITFIVGGGVGVELLQQIIEKLRVEAAIGQIEKLHEDTRFHLAGCLVGEGDGEDISISGVGLIEKGQFDIFQGQVVGLS